MMHWIRRAPFVPRTVALPLGDPVWGHGFLFNHPAAVSDQRMKFFTADDLRETPLAALPSSEELAAEVVRKLNELQIPATPYEFIGNSRFY